MAAILAIDADAAVRRTYRLALARFGQVIEAASPVEAAAELKREPPALIVAEWPADGSGPAVFAMLRQWAADTPAVAMLTWRTPEEEALARDSGAAVCLAKPFRIEDLAAAAAALLGETSEPALQKAAPAGETAGTESAEPLLPALIASSASMQAVAQAIAPRAGSSLTLTGEPGTGKRTLALYAAGAAFAENGGLCIDAAEVEGGALAQQVRATLNPGSVPPPPMVVLEAHLLPAELAALLADAMHDGRRLLATVSAALPPGWAPAKRLQVPPLRERPEDLPALAQRLLAKVCRQVGAPAKELSAETARWIQQQPWRGNLPQLEGFLAAETARNPRGEVVAPTDSALAAPGQKAPDIEGIAALSLREATRRFERGLIAQALEEAAGVQTRAAERLGTTRRILKYKMDQLGLS